MNLSKAGSSPLTRGKLDTPPGSPRPQRLIPAHAGKTLTPAGQLVIDGGSSPLTRGKQSRRDGAEARGGLIPAHAGKTPVLCDGRVLGAAHPRSRGENPALCGGPGAMGGSSPLTRGKLHMWRQSHASLGLIPAHAGKTG